MKQTIDFHQFRNAFQKISLDNFSNKGLRCLFDYLGEELKLDVVAICCNYSEDNWKKIGRAYGVEIDPNASDEDNQQRVVDYLTDEGAYIGEAGDSIVYRNF